MTVHRFFVSPSQIGQGDVHFTPDQSRQLAVVLRLRDGDAVEVLDNAGWRYDVRLSDVSPGAARGTIRSRSLASGEPRTKLTLYPAMIKADHLEIVLQKCTELGVSAFVPTITARTVVGGSASENKVARWERIIAEAAEQSERGRLPQLFPVTLFSPAIESTRGLSFIAAERGERASLRAALRAHLDDETRPFAVNLFVGPEGGFTEEEVASAAARGIVPVGLGPRILRAETSSIVGATMILSGLGDLE